LMSMVNIVARKHPQRAARLVGATEAMRESRGLALEVGDRIEYETGIQMLQSQLGEQLFSSLRAEGRSLRLEEIVRETLRTD
jgi:hypothetical protein